MVGMNKLNIERPDLDSVACLDYIEFRLHRMFLEFVFNNPESKVGAVNRYIKLPQKIRKRPDMVLVPMREHYRLYLFKILFEICCVRNHKVDSGCVIIGKRKTAVKHNNSVIVFKHRHVFPYFVKTSQRDNLKLGFF